MKKIQGHCSVHKFGGSSLADAKRFVDVKSLLAGKDEIIVVSATKGTTSTLQTMLDAAKGQHAVEPLLADLEKTHIQLMQTLLPNSKKTAMAAVLKKDLEDIKNILQTVLNIGSYSAEIQDVVLGYGEQWSAQILAAYLAEFHRVLYVDATTVLFTYHNKGILCIDWEKSRVALEKFLNDKNFDQIVITGFIAATREGQRTTLGRNGSDFSAAIFAKLFKAQSLTIWTDVDGIFTADPQRVRSAFAIESLSYKEAFELAYFGAKVLHPMTIAPAFECQIPIYIKNSLNPAAKGTEISQVSKKSPYLIKGLTCIDNATLINVEGAGVMGASSIPARVFQILEHINVSAILISQASSEHSICFVVQDQYAEQVMAALTENLQFEIETKQIEKIHADNECAVLAVVGEGMKGAIGVCGSLCATLAKASINIRALAQGSSELNISVVVNRKAINKALKAVHAGFYLSNKTISIGLIGPGTVGSALLAQIAQANESLKEKYQINFCVRGIMNSKKMLLDDQAIDLNHWQEQIHHSNAISNIQGLADHILSDDVPHAVMIDCTANKEVASHYLEFIERGIHVITPNKYTNGGDLNYYKKLKSLVQQKHCYYLYEATVCAGLPIINTLHDLIKTGDEILAAEGVVSGTLSYVFSELAKGRLFSDVVFEAKKRGFTEPDPREDLSGMDVARKLVCLAREMGHDVLIEDVKVHNLVPQDLRSCSVTEFMEKLPAYDHQMADLLAAAKAKRENLYYAGAIREDGSVHVAIEAFPQDHPFTRMKGTDNMLIFHTRRYSEQPLIIQGPGAGAEVTAAGIFADLLRLASFLS